MVRKKSKEDMRVRDYMGGMEKKSKAKKSRAKPKSKGLPMESIYSLSKSIKR